MSIKKTLYDKAGEEMKKSIKLRKCASDQSLSFDKARDLSKKQDEAFKKFKFFQNLNKAISEEKK